MSFAEVKSAKRVLEILAFFAAEKAPASLARISSALNFPKSSCLGLLETLVGEGYAYTVDGRYYLTGRWQRESQAVADHDQVAARCRPTLEALHRELNETVVLAQLTQGRVVYLDVIESDTIVRFSARVGQRKPIHAAASGRALLAALPEEERTRIARSITYEKLTSATLTSQKALLHSVAEGARRGWHVNLGEHQPDTVSVAASLLLHGVPLAFVVGAPMSRVKSKVATIGAALARAAHQLQAADKA